MSPIMHIMPLMAGIDDIGGQVLPQGEWNGPYGLMEEERNGEFYHFVLGKLGSSRAAVDPLKKGRRDCRGGKHCLSEPAGFKSVQGLPDADQDGQP